MKRSNRYDDNAFGKTHDGLVRPQHANDDPRADEILATAHGLLQERAANIEDEAVRRSFLENVAAHREIVEEFGRMRSRG